MTVALPINIDFKDWASQIRIDLPNIAFPNPPDIKFWRGWADQVINSSGLSNLPLPTRSVYPKDEDWKIWAAYFINSAYT